jgi:hypothetical protein
MFGSGSDRQRIRKIEQARLRSLWGTCRGAELVKEALLTRGFLTTLDQRGLMLAEGSHVQDGRMLERIPDLFIRPGRWSSCSISVGSAHARAIARRIIDIPDGKGFTSTGVGPFISASWRAYRKMRYGALLAIADQYSGSLDLGVALLVKALPLARVGTHMSCDGHGLKPARIWFWTRWDAFWFEAILGRFPPGPGARWSITFGGWPHGALSIEPDGDIANNQALAAMLGSIRSFARGLLDTERAQFFGNRRQGVMDMFGEREPDDEEWRQACVGAMSGDR